MSASPCVPPPARPHHGPSDWAKAIRGNCFSNIERLGRWTGGGTIVLTGCDPSAYFQPVAPGSLGAGTDPPSICVVAHGWAPGYRPVVDASGGNLLWWGSAASLNGVWASDWAWSPVSVADPPVTVNGTGVQSIAAFEPFAAILAYSWIDDSATDARYAHLVDVYQSEAYTHLNGIRLANALQEAIAPSFWFTSSGLVRIIEPSHGSKVATVAALRASRAPRTPEAPA